MNRKDSERKAQMKEKFEFLSGNTLKIIACVFMLCDHLAYILLPELVWLRWIGRLAFPIFAFFISEGCKFTHDKVFYFLQILLFGLIFCVVQYVATGVLYLNIFITFAVSILLIYSLNRLKRALFSEERKPLNIAASLLIFAVLTTGAYLLCLYVKVDYGFWGIMLAVFFSLFDFAEDDAPKIIKKIGVKYVRLLCGAVAMLFLCLTTVLHYQWICFVSLILLFAYNGRRGNKKLKYFFYIFYPAHIIILYGISMVI